jgi:hypothetical protein
MLSRLFSGTARPILAPFTQLVAQRSIQPSISLIAQQWSRGMKVRKSSVVIYMDADSHAGTNIGEATL